MPETIAISKFKAKCLRLLDNVKKTGNSILVTRKALRDAVEQERFEEAARLRDELVRLYPGKQVPPSPA